MDVGFERERCGMVPEPALYLNGVRATCKEHRGAGMAQGVETGPRGSRLLHCGEKRPTAQVLDMQRCAGLGGEREIVISRPLALLSPDAQRRYEVGVQRHVAPTVSGLRRADTPPNDGAADLDVRVRAVQMQVAPLDGDRLRDA